MKDSNLQPTEVLAIYTMGPKCNLYLSNQLKITEVTKFLHKHIEMKPS